MATGGGCGDEREAEGIDEFVLKEDDPRGL